MILRTPHDSRHYSERGVILIVVLWLSFGLVTMAIIMGGSMSLEYRASNNTLASLQASQALEGAAHYVMYLMANQDTPGLFPEETAYRAEQVPLGEATFWFLGRPNSLEFDNQPVFRLVDEASKLNLNTASQEMLEALPNMTAELAAAIIDWRDEDSEVSTNGAESDAYTMRSPGYPCKNAAFETVEELLLLQGADPLLLFGEDTNGNGALDQNENDGAISLPIDNQDGQLTRGILDYLTVYTREPNTNSDGETKANVTTEEGRTQVIEKIQETFSEDRANEVQQALSGSQEEINSVLQFYKRSGLTADEFAQIADEISITDDEFQYGLINVNTAPEEVLACIPGIGEDNASTLVSYRQSNTSRLTSITWVAEALDDEEALNEAGPYLTAYSYQIMADVAAVGRNGNGYQRAQFIIDNSGSKPQIIYRRDRSREGWALGSQVRQQIVQARLEQKNNRR